MSVIKNLNIIFLRVITLLMIFTFVDFSKSRFLLANQELQTELKDYIKNFPDNNFYILGPGDFLKIEVSEFTSDLDQKFIIDGQGIAKIQRLNDIYVSGLTIEELTKILNKEYEKYLKKPNVKLTILKYRPVKVYLSGEVESPGYYVLKGTYFEELESEEIAKRDLIFNNFFPSLFFVIRESGGVTVNADLKNVIVTRQNSITNGSGRIQTNLNLINTISLNDLSQNIRILDGDTIYIPKSDVPVLSDIAMATRTNINPKFIEVFVNGRVNNPGKIKLNKGITLNEAIEISGGTKVIKGKLVFLRYNPDGTVDRRKFSIKRSAKRGSYKNPYLRSGDFINLERGLLGTTTEVLGDITDPFNGLVSTYGLLKIIND